MPDTDWRIVMLKSPDAAGDQALNPANWRKVLASGRSDAQGMCQLTPNQRRIIWRRAQGHPGKVHVVYGGISASLDQTTLAAAEHDQTTLQTLSASNYMSDLSDLDRAQQSVLRRWIQGDFNVSSISKPKVDTAL